MQVELGCYANKSCVKNEAYADRTYAGTEYFVIRRYCVENGERWQRSGAGYMGGVM